LIAYLAKLQPSPALTLPVIAMSTVSYPQVHLWTRQEYHRMASTGLFDGRRVELIEGQVIDMAAMKSSHAVTVDLVAAVLTVIFGPGYYIRQQKPFVIGDISEPEPDVAVIKGSIRDFTDAHPTEAELIVEVADTSLNYDRTLKQSLYAKAGITEYWIVNLVDRLLEFYRQPGPDPDAEYGFCYQMVAIYRADQQVAPLTALDRALAVADILP
jgi:Uma2 family endonuclease